MFNLKNRNLFNEELEDKRNMFLISKGIQGVVKTGRVLLEYTAIDALMRHYLGTGVSEMGPMAKAGAVVAICLADYYGKTFLEKFFRGKTANELIMESCIPTIKAKQDGEMWLVVNSVKDGINLLLTDEEFKEFESKFALSRALLIKVAIKDDCKVISYLRGGKLHREGGPAIQKIDQNGAVISEAYYENGKLNPSHGKNLTKGNPHDEPSPEDKQDSPSNIKGMGVTF